MSLLGKLLLRYSLLHRIDLSSSLDLAGHNENRCLISMPFGHPYSSAQTQVTPYWASIFFLSFGKFALTHVFLTIMELHLNSMLCYLKKQNKRVCMQYK